LDPSLLSTRIANVPDVGIPVAEVTTQELSPLPMVPELLSVVEIPLLNCHVGMRDSYDVKALIPMYFTA
jgi:hypothetical protein